MLTLTEKDWKKVDQDLQLFFWENYYQPLLDILKDPIYNRRYNSNSAVISALRSGRIRYEDGIFSGSFNAEISKELSKYAEFNRVTKLWEGTPPAEVTAAAVSANDKADQLNRRMLSQISTLSDQVKKKIEEFRPRITGTINRMSQQIEKDVSNITVLPEITPELRERLDDEYTHNMQLNIVNESQAGDRKGNWNEEQVTRLREMVEQNVTRGSNKKELEQSIMSEWGVSQRKARFLARQETHLLMSDLRNERYYDAGIKIYQWINSKDVRVVGTPGGKYPKPTKGHGNHYVMGGKYCLLSDPTVYADSLSDAKAGRWKSKKGIMAGESHPGEEYLCRCRMKAVII